MQLSIYQVCNLKIIVYLFKKKFISKNKNSITRILKAFIRSKLMIVLDLIDKYKNKFEETISKTH